MISHYEQDKKTLLLDLDNTLIYASKEIPEVMDFTAIAVNNLLFISCLKLSKFEKGSEFFMRYVTKRPGMGKFLSKLSKKYNLCVYTAAEKTV